METQGIEAESEKRNEMIKSFIRPDIPESENLKALSECDYRAELADIHILDKTPGYYSSPPETVKKTLTSTGARISTQINEENGEKKKGSQYSDGENEKTPTGMDFESDMSVIRNDNEMSKGSLGNLGLNFNNPCEVEKGYNFDMALVKKNEIDAVIENKAILNEEGLKVPGMVQMENGDKITAKKENWEESDMVLEKKQDLQDEKCNLDGVVPSESVGRSRLSFEEWLKLPENNHPQVNEGSSQEVEKSQTFVRVKEEPNVDGDNNSNNMSIVKQEEPHHGISAKPNVLNESKDLVKKKAGDVLCVQPLSARSIPEDEYSRIRMGSSDRHALGIQKQAKVEDKMLSTVMIENGDFPEEPDWLLVGRNLIMGLSTTKGRKIETNEIVEITFPTGKMLNKSGIVRFSTKRNGEIGRLPMEWSKCLTPLVNSSKVKVLGRCISAPTNLHLMQEIMLYVSFFIHHSVFKEVDKSSWKLELSDINSTTYPLLTLFKLLKMNPFQEAEFTPEELDSRKRSLKLADDSDNSLSMLHALKRRKGCQQLSQQDGDSEAMSESYLNKVVGAADMYDLEEMEPPRTLMCDLRPYQKQALFWMTESEKGADVEEAAKTLHPCWQAYRICDERASAIYVNIFSGEASTQLPTATQMARGGILADAMGLGKTVMTIALLLARRGRGTPEDQELITDSVDDTEYMKKKNESDKKFARKVEGGTLIICPMALLGQWKDELETHSMPDSLSVSVFYGGDRSTDPRVIASPDVILTTYGVLMAAYKNDGVNSIFHRVDWYRVVLDEAHTIKSSRTLCAQAAFGLSSYCRWCLTGTPLQNKLEDLYSLLCFLRVEPWCNWPWWQKLIQKPYENGDPRGMKLIRAILRPLMLRRTKETKDKEGRPILVLPPTDIKLIECEQSEAERDFYDALFKKSKVQFDQFVAQGKVLHNYANILELLLRLRQCCNHPFLVMSRGDTQDYADLNKLARRFLEMNPDSATQKVPSRAYVEEVVEGIRKGENTECPICLESADDPVLTPCAHRMCRECLLSSWRTPIAGTCPICRQLVKKTELITCPSENRFRIDVEKNWKESSKVSKLLDCLERLRQSGSGEKSIVFSQWTSFLDLLEIPLKRRKIGFLRFDGKLTQKQRETVLREFNETGEKMIMLMSLKAGGVGLNLTAASNVFLMDPWWNPAVEEQAIMRIHRIGQKRTVRVRRFIVKDTVEERLQQVQARKQRMIAGALTDEEVRSARIEELKMLFR